MIVKLHTFSRTKVLFSICCLGLVFVVYTASAPVLLDDIEVDGLTDGESHLLQTKVHNWSLRAITLIGANERCYLEGCAKPIGCPIKISPFSTSTINVEFSPRSQPFDFEMKLVLQSNVKLERLMHIRSKEK